MPTIPLARPCRSVRRPQPGCYTWASRPTHACRRGRRRWRAGRGSASARARRPGPPCPACLDDPYRFGGCHTWRRQRAQSPARYHKAQRLQICPKARGDAAGASSGRSCLCRLGRPVLWAVTFLEVLHNWRDAIRCVMRVMTPILAHVKRGNFIHWVNKVTRMVMSWRAAVCRPTGDRVRGVPARGILPGETIKQIRTEVHTAARHAGPDPPWQPGTP